MEAVEALALVGGHVDEELLVRNEYLAAENRILKSKLKNLCNSTIVRGFNWQKLVNDWDLRL